MLDRFRGMHLTRLATAHDVAFAALFLASSEAEVISGVQRCRSTVAAQHSTG